MASSGVSQFPTRTSPRRFAPRGRRRCAASSGARSPLSAASVAGFRIALNCNVDRRRRKALRFAHRPGSAVRRLCSGPASRKFDTSAETPGLWSRVAFHHFRQLHQQRRVAYGCRLSIQDHLATVPALITLLLLLARNTTNIDHGTYLLPRLKSAARRGHFFWQCRSEREDDGMRRAEVDTTVAQRWL